MISSGSEATRGPLPSLINGLVNDSMPHPQKPPRINDDPPIRSKLIPDSQALLPDYSSRHSGLEKRTLHHLPLPRPSGQATSRNGLRSGRSTWGSFLIRSGIEFIGISQQILYGPDQHLVPKAEVFGQTKPRGITWHP